VWFSEKLLSAGEERASAYLRGALAELVSMEEVQALDRPGSVVLKTRDSQHPLLHLLALVRHLNVHVKSVKTGTHEVSAKFDEHEFELDIPVVANLSASDLLALRNGKHYTQVELERLVTWFNKAQLHWGAGYVVRVCAEAYAEEIAAHHGC
jgi:hypothetical protein